MPYNPGITDRSGELLGRGIENAGQSFAGMISRIREERDANDAADVALETAYASNPGSFEKFLRSKGDTETPSDELLASFIGKSTRAKKEALLGGVTAQFLREAKQAETGFTAERTRALKDETDKKGQYEVRTDSGWPGVAVVADLSSGRIIPVNMSSAQASSAPDGTPVIDRATGKRIGTYANGKAVLDQFGMASGGINMQTGAPIMQPFNKSTGQPVNFGAGAFPAGSPGAATPAPAAAPAARGVPRVKSKAERDALPAGTSYIGPDGKTYIKR